MITISLCMIVKNEEEVIERLLGPIREVIDEIIIVDTGSTDKTKEICGKYADKLLDFEWIHDFSAARNFAFEQGTKDYLFWLDADDILLPEDLERLKKLKETMDPSVDVVNMTYSVAQDENGKPTVSLRRNRILKRENNYRFGGAVHEAVAVWGNILHSDVIITHKPLSHDANRNIEIYQKREEKGEEFSPRDLYYYGNELLDHGQLKKAIEYYEKFLNTTEGWVEDYIAACSKLADCYMNVGDSDKERESIYRVLEYDKPRAEGCCRIAFRFMRTGKWEQAIFWYTLATTVKKPENCWGSFNEACWTWIPHIQLCVCYFNIKEYKLAYEHNERAREFLPEDARVLHNKKLIGPMIGIKEE